MSKKILLLLFFFIGNSHAQEVDIIENSLEELISGDISWFVFEGKDKVKSGDFIQCSNEGRYVVCNFPVKLFLLSPLPGNVYKEKHNPGNELIKVEGAIEQINVNSKIITTIKSLAKKNTLLVKDYYYKAFDVDSNLVGSGLDIDIAMKINGDMKHIYNFIIDYFNNVAKLTDINELQIRTSKDS